MVADVRSEKTREWYGSGKNTPAARAGNAVNLIRERGASVFDASVPKRVGMQKVVGHAFPSNLNGYEDVYLELEEAIA